MRIAYICNRYPSVSTAFIHEEVEALRALGVDVHTFSVRRANMNELVSPAYQQAAATTHAVVPPRWVELLRAHARAITTRPIRYLSTLRLALHLSPPGLRGRLWQLFHFTEAMPVWDQCRGRELRHLHAHFVNAATDVALLVTHFGGPGWSWSLTLHGPAEFYDVSKVRLPEKVARARFVVCISDFARSQVMAQVDERHWKKLHVVHCGVDPDRFSPRQNGYPPNGPLRILHVGRLVDVKGQALLVEALALLAQRGVSAVTTIVGDGPRRDALERRVRELGIDQRVEFTGALGHHEVPDRYAAADAFCLSSFSEGVPVVLMEAMAMGVPVVATRVMGIPELVDHGVTGLLVAPTRADALADALALLADAPALRRELARAGREKVVREFNLGRSAQRLRDLFQEFALAA